MDDNARRFAVGKVRRVGAVVVRIALEDRRVGPRCRAVLRQLVCLGGVAVEVLALALLQTREQLRDGGAEALAADEHLRVLGLLLGVLPTFAQLQILLLLAECLVVLADELAHPEEVQRIELALVGCRLAHDVGGEVEVAHLAVHVQTDTRCQRAYHGPDADEGGHVHGAGQTLQRVAHAHGEGSRGDAVDVVLLVALLSLVKCLHEAQVVGILRLDAQQHLMQARRHAGNLFLQGAVDALHLLLLREAVVAGYHLVQQLTREAADVPEVACQLKRQRVAVRLHRLLPPVVNRPPLFNNGTIRDAQIRENTPSLLPRKGERRPTPDPSRDGGEWAAR